MKNEILQDKDIIMAGKIAKKSHEGQKYANHDYFEYHLINVLDRSIDLAIKMGKQYEEVKNIAIVALLHDIVEDCNYSVDKIRDLFGENIATSVKMITYDKNKQTREEYYNQIYLNEMAKIVKYADASENKYNCMKDGDKKRVKYYDNIARKMLKF